MNKTVNNRNYSLIQAIKVCSLNIHTAQTLLLMCENETTQWCMAEQNLSYGFALTKMFSVVGTEISPTSTGISCKLAA